MLQLKLLKKHREEVEIEIQELPILTEVATDNATTEDLNVIMIEGLMIGEDNGFPPSRKLQNNYGNSKKQSFTWHKTRTDHY